MSELSKPEIINQNHRLEAFESGENTLDDWLKQRALKNGRINATKTFVVHIDNYVTGYYSLATGSIEHNQATRTVKRNMPNPIPVMVLGRLAVDKAYQGSGLGRGLLKDAVLRTYNVSRQVGIKALLVHAISDSAKHFYKRFGFTQSPLDEMTLMLPIENIHSD